MKWPWNKKVDEFNVVDSKKEIDDRRQKIEDAARDFATRFEEVMKDLAKS
jgi:hypothetical protein